MKLLFDLFSAQSPSGQKAGGFEFVNIIFKHMYENYSEEVELHAFFDFSIPMEPYLEDIVKQIPGRYDVRDIREVESICRNHKFDVFYSGLPYRFNFDLRFNGMQTVGTLHGLREYEITDDYYKYKYSNLKKRGLLRKIKRQIMYMPFVCEKREQRKKELAKKKYEAMIRQFDRLFCVSNHSKYAFKALYGNKYPDIEVFYSPMKYRTEAAEIKDKKYILLIMGDRYRKNTYRAIKAIDDLHRKGMIQEYAVMVAGESSYQITKEFESNDQIIFMNEYVSAERLEILYAECSIFLFPSLNEGFGYPPIEAMRYGKTCVVAADTSMPEIYGDSVYYVNPYDIFEIETRILQAIENPIDVKHIWEKCDILCQRQNEDLDNICRYILKQGDI